MSDNVDIQVEINRETEKLTVVIKNHERNETVEGIIAAVQAYADRQIPVIPAYLKDRLVILPQEQIIRIYIVGRKVTAETAKEHYEIRKPLKDIELLLEDSRFVRISQSEIINLRMVKSFDFSTSGTIGVLFENGEKTYVARRRVREVKQALAGRDGHGY